MLVGVEGVLVEGYLWGEILILSQLLIKWQMRGSVLRATKVSPIIILLGH